MMRRYEEGLAAYTYLVDDDAEIGRDDGGPRAAHNSDSSVSDSFSETTADPLAEGSA